MSTLVETWKISDDHYHIVITTKHRWNKFHYYFKDGRIHCQFNDHVTGKLIEMFSSKMVINTDDFFIQEEQEKDQVIIGCIRMATYNEELIYSEVIP